MADVLAGKQTKGKKSSGGLKKFNHALIVFGNSDGGIEQSIDDDEDFVGIGGEGAVRKVFDVVVAPMELQGSRGIRVEEQMLIVLGQMRSAFVENTRKWAGVERKSAVEEEQAQKKVVPVAPVVFSDAELSEESDDDDN
jgi:hypothetical protein